jgi:hypothetical protein
MSKLSDSSNKGNELVNNCQQIVKLFWRFTVGFCRNKVAHNEKVLWKLGDLKLVRPNVRPYKLLYFNYLQMFGSFRPPKQKYKRIPNVQLLPSAPIATILCWRLPLLSVAMRIQNKGHKYQHQ